LLEIHADVEAADLDELTAIEIAAKKNKRKLVELLGDHGARWKEIFKTNNTQVRKLLQRYRISGDGTSSRRGGQA
jgi:ankyrin repeat protein